MWTPGARVSIYCLGFNTKYVFPAAIIFLAFSLNLKNTLPDQAKPIDAKLEEDCFSED